MVKWLLLVLITAGIDNNKSSSGSPVAGTVSITHSEKEKVDENSFLLDNSPLKVEKSSEVPISQDTTITFYKFTLPPQQIGLRVLPSISAVVGGERYASVPATYEVKGAPKIPKPQAAPLQLNARIEAPSPLFPGQRALFIYEIAFDKNIALSKEILPLMQAEGLTKIGGPQAETFVRDGQTVQRITQIVKATKPGKFTYGPSLIEGQAFTTDYAGKKTTFGPLLSSSFPALTLEVSPFPENGRPISFTGTVGEYQLAVKLLTSPKVTLGDTMTLSVAMTGDGVPENVKMPNLNCEPGWSGLFSLSDLPPSVHFQGKTKTFTLDIRPLTTLVKQIPPIAFTYLHEGTYVTLKSEPIPIAVAPSPTKEAPLVKQELPENEQEAEAPPLHTLTAADLQAPHTLKVLWLIPIGALLLLLKWRRK